jgi:hypothetical protein
MSCPTLTLIDPNQCIGNSLQYINSNFFGLSAAVCSKVDRAGDTMTGPLTIGAGDLTVQGGNVDLANNKLNHFAVTVKEVTVSSGSPAYTLLPSDCGAVLHVTCAANGYIYIPTGLPIGYNIMVINKSTNSLTIGQQGGVTINNAYNKVTIGNQWGICNIIITSANLAVISGDLV